LIGFFAREAARARLALSKHPLFGTKKKGFERLNMEAPMFAAS